MRQYKKLWFLLFAVLAVCFTMPDYMGSEVYRKTPPYPEKIALSSGQVLMTKDDILAGQSAWQITGGMGVGPVLGHNAYQAPDQTAGWLCRELIAWLNLTAQKNYGKKLGELTEEQKTVLKTRAAEEYHNQSHIQADGSVVLSDTRVKAIGGVTPHYMGVYGDDPKFQSTREHFVMKDNMLSSTEARQKLFSFFSWASRSASANRPDEDSTYTNNWPHKPLTKNVSTTEDYMWPFTSVVLSLVNIGLLIWGYLLLTKHEEVQVPTEDPISKVRLTPSQKALDKCVFLTVVLSVTQVLSGGLAAHYTVEDQGFYGIDVALGFEVFEWFPCALTRTWCIQSVTFWIATDLLTAGLFSVPIVNGSRDLKLQCAGVNFLYIALFTVVIGSYAGNFIVLTRVIPPELDFWLGHQGYEYLDLGRFWQLLLMVGLLLWLFLMLRYTVTAFKEGDTDKNLLAIFVASVVDVGVFYTPGLFYGEKSPTAVIEYWRWWAIHLWVEGFFEVSATAAFTFILYSMDFVYHSIATTSTLATATILMLSGIPGTLHYLYFSGSTSASMAVGTCFSALEVVPLVLLGREVYEHQSCQHLPPWAKRLRQPPMYFVTVAFWNIIGAGVFGFLIDPPIPLFYIQGLNTTVVHAHVAPFGMYGFLALGFVLLVTRYLKPDVEFDDLSPIHVFEPMRHS